MTKKRILTLTLTKYLYDLIECGYKKEEYREIKPFFNSRFEGRSYDEVVFINGYHPGARRMCLQVTGIKKAKGVPDWGGDPHHKQWVIYLGKLLWSKG